MEEERRLCYVGITRAMKRLYMVRAFRRSMMGSSMVNLPSRFLSDIPSHLVDGNNGKRAQERAPEQPSVRRGMPWNKQPVVPLQEAELPQLKPGERVRHAQFGEGTVVSTLVVNNDIQATIAFNGGGVKKLLLSFARLEKV